MLKTLPRHGVIGLILVITFWTVNWGLDGLRTHLAFFPLWLGYILFVDAWSEQRGATSIVRTSPLKFILLFVVSAPLWWVFEFLNRWAHYWHYAPIEKFSDLEYYAYCTLNFTTVVPAVFVTAQLLSTFPYFRKRRQGVKTGRTLVSQALYFTAGWVMLAALIVFPQFSMAFMWISLFFILDPINLWLGNPSLLGRVSIGDWRLVRIFMLAPLICGFFWEMWNFYSLPKWYYTVPFVDFLHIFEMPLVGYLGYLPFGLELFAMIAMVQGLFRLSLLPVEGTM